MVILNIVNFSSPHSFRLDNGREIPAVEPEVSRLLSLEVVEQEVPHPSVQGVTDIRIGWRLTQPVIDRLEQLEQDDNVDVVLVPLPVMTAIKEAGRPIGKARVCRVADRITKVIHHDRFCV